MTMDWLNPSGSFQLRMLNKNKHSHFNDTYQYLNMYFETIFWWEDTKISYIFFCNIFWWAVSSYFSQEASCIAFILLVFQSKKYV